MELTTEFELSPSCPTPSRSPREQVMEMIQVDWVSQICGTTARLALVDQLHGGPRTVSELASLTSTAPSGLGRLLRAGATAGLFTEFEDERFALTPLGGQLTNGDDGRRAPRGRLGSLNLGEHPRHGSVPAKALYQDAEAGVLRS
jgi:hypothetical protein